MDVTQSAATPTATPASAAGMAAAAKSARDFESVFVGQMTKIMMETVETKGDFTGGHGEEMFRGVLAEKLGGVIVARGGLGLAPAVMKQIIALQGGAPQSVTPQGVTPPSVTPKNASEQGEQTDAS